MGQGLKHANKCRDCSKTIDVGVAAWFNKDGEPGRKTTCVDCHKRKVGENPEEAAAEAEAAAAENKLLKTLKKRKLMPKVTAELVTDKEKGLASVYRTFPKLKFRGKGHEAADLRRLLNKYSDWAHILLPEMEFSDFVGRLEKISGNYKIRGKLELLRNVQQGLCTLDEIDDLDYDLAARNEGEGRHFEGFDWDQGLGGDDGLGDEIWSVAF